MFRFTWHELEFVFMHFFYKKKKCNLFCLFVFLLWRQKIGKLIIQRFPHLYKLCFNLYSFYIVALSFAPGFMWPAKSSDPKVYVNDHFFWKAHIKYLFTKQILLMSWNISLISMTTQGFVPMGQIHQILCLSNQEALHAWGYCTTLMW